MAQDTPVGDALDELVRNAVSTKSNVITSSGTVPDPLKNMLSIFEQAFPDQTFVAKEGGIVGTPKVVSPAAAIPVGYAPERALTGIDELQKSLENKDLTDEERYSIAVRLNTMVQTQKMYKFDQYRQQAEAMFGIPDLLQTIEALKRAEAVSPYNPGGGAMSQQRFEVLQTLATSRTAAANRVKDLMATDPTYAAAENLAGGAIAEIEGRLKIAERGERIDLKRQLKDARESQIAAIDPNVIASIGMLRNGRAPETPEERRSIAERLIDNKLHLSKFETAIVSADDESLKGYYNATKDPKERQIVIQVLQGRETLAIGNAEQAKINIRLFEAAMKVDPSDKTDQRVTPEIRRKWAAIQQDVMRAKAMGTDKSDAELVNERKLAIHREILNDVVQKAVFGNVKQWQGVMQSDVAAQAVLKIWKGDRPMSVNDFIDHYLEYNDGRKMEEKSRSLQAIIVSAIESLPRSSVLPIPDAKSALLTAQKMVAVRSITRSFNTTGFIGLDLLRSNLPGVNK